MEADTSTSTTILEVNEVTAGYDARPVLVDASIRLEQGDMLALCGPNGAGKSTLLRVMSRLLTPRRGRVLLHDEPVGQIGRRALARKMAVMPQSPSAPPGVSVRELIGYGRSPHTTWLKPFSSHDQKVIDDAICICDLQSLQHRQVDTLSGGERQRAWLAMAIAQEPQVLLLDEPVSALDIGHQLEVLSLLSDLNTLHGTTVVIVLHDINLAARYCKSLAAVCDHRVVAAGPMDRALTSELLEAVFGVSAAVHRLDGLDYPICTFDRRGLAGGG